jgi:hypothetical protein
MICISYHSPAALSLSLDTEKYNLVSVFNDQELINIKLAAHNVEKNRVLFINGIERLLVYARNKPNRMRKFKIVVFDLPHNFFQRKYDIVDAVKVDGIWTPKTIKKFSRILKKTNKGTKEKL